MKKKDKAQASIGAVMTNLSLQDREKKIRGVTVWGIVLNIGLTGIKILSGVFARSSALLADGMHSFSDLATDFIVLLSSRISNQPADKTHPYGHKRFETIASMFLGLVLLAASCAIIWSASKSIYRSEQRYAGLTLLVVAGISVIAKEVIFRITRKVSQQTNSSILYANAWHHRTDALSSVAVLIGGVAMLFGWGYADQAAAIVVGLIIVIVAGKIFYEGMIELTERCADEDSLLAIERVLSVWQGISGWHELRTRRVGGELFIDVHILVRPDLTVLESHEISVKLEEKIRNSLSKPVNILIHIDPENTPG